MRPNPLLALALATLAAAVLPAGSDRNVKLNGPLAPLPSGSVRNYQLTADGSVAVYEMQGVLFSVPVDGSSPQVQLTPGPIAPVTGNLRTSDYPLTADGARVVFRAVSGNGIDELYSVPVDGSAPPARISGGGSVLPFDQDRIAALSPDGSRAVYRSDSDLAQVFELYSVPVDGTLPPVKLNPSYTSIEDVTDVEISADGSFVVYRANQDINYRYELYRVPIDGSAPAFRVNPDLVPGGSVQSDFVLTSDGGRVVYRADQDTNMVFEVFGVPLDGSQASAKLSPPLATTQQVLNLRVDPNGLHAAFVVRTVRPPLNPDLMTLWLSPVDGLAPPVSLGVVGTDSYSTRDYHFTPLGRIVYEDQGELRSALSNGGGGTVYLSNAFVAWEVSADGTYVVYTERDPPSGSEINLFKQQVNGFGPTRQLNTDQLRGHALSPDGTLVVFASGDAGRTITEIVTLDESAPPLPFAAGSAIGLVTPDNTRVVFRDDARIESFSELFSVRTDASQPILRLSEPQGSSQAARVNDFAISLDGQRVVFLAEGDQPGMNELYAAPVDGSSAEIRLNSPLVDLGDILDFALSPDSTRVVYRGNQYADGVIALFSVPIDGSAAAIPLSDALDPGCFVCEVSDYRITADGAYVVYRAAQDPPSPFELYSVPIDGSAPTVRLNTDLPQGAVLADDFLVTPDGSRVVYRLEPTGSPYELYGVPVDGGGLPTRLDVSAVAHLGARDFQVSGDSTRVVFRAIRDLPVVAIDRDLYSAPNDGSSPAVKIGGASDNSDTVDSYAISPDSMTVVYSLDVDGALGDAIWSIAVDGSRAPVLLSESLPEDGRLDDLRISSDSQRVVFTQVTADGFELFSVPVDGSATRTKLNPELPQFGDVGRFEISPDSSRVVYLADQEVDGVFALYSVLIDGGPSRRVSQTLPSGSFGAFRISPDSRYVVHIAVPEASGLIELFAARIEGWSGEPLSITVNGPLVAGGGVDPDAFAVTPDSTRVVYLARQESVGMIELFSTFVLPAPASVSPNTGPATGGNEVVITGSGFTPETEVFFAGRPGTVTYISSSELRVVVPENLRTRPPTRGPAVGKTRQVVLRNLVVDLRVETADLGATLPEAYGYQPWR